ncbi:MAG: autotransporter-associated beta strand repeat-containing protein [Bradyrhizobium sp.]
MASAFFLNNSVLFNLAGQAVGYTSNFVTDVNIATTSASPLVIDSNSVPLGLAGVISGSGPVRIVNGGSATLSGTNSYTGATTVNNGFLALVGAGQHFNVERRQRVELRRLRYFRRGRRFAVRCLYQVTIEHRQCGACSARRQSTRSHQCPR